MANHYATKRIQFGAATALFMLLGCSGDDASTTSDLSSAALDIQDTVDSQAAATTQAKDCFAEFKSCKEAVGGDAKACTDTLKACLPEEAPRSSRCDADGGSDRDDDVDEDADETTDEASRPDGGVSDDHGGFRHGRGRGPGCGRPAIAPSRFRECTTATATSVTSGMDTTAAAGDHEHCIQKAFTDRIESLCDHATKLCERADAQADICGQIATACSSVKN